MWTRLCATVPVVLAVLWGNAAQSGGGDDARAIVDKAIKAMGGEANLAKQKSAQWKEKGVYYGQGMGLDYTGTYAQQYPDKFRMDIKDVFMMVLNGDKLWMKMQGGETREMDKETAAVEQQSHRAGWVAGLWPLKDKAFKLKALGESKVEGKPALGVLVSRQGYPDVKLYFDKASSLLVKSEFRGKVPEEKFKEATMETFYGNYKDVDGTKMPYKIGLKRDGKRFVEAEVQDVQIGGKLDEKLFMKP